MSTATIHSAPGWACAVLILLLAPLAVAADEVVVLESQLPSERQATSAAAVGGDIYVFGGHEGTNTRLKQIVRFSPSSGDVHVMGGAFITGRSHTSAVGAGSVAYVFGGHDGATYLADIVKYDAATDLATLLTSALPSPRALTSTVWTGSVAYVFGGADNTFSQMEPRGQGLTGIVKFDPGTGLATTVADLPHGRSATLAAWDGSYAWVFGGHDENGALDEIVRFNPSNNEVKKMDTRLPYKLEKGSAVWDGSKVYLLGGNSGSSSSSKKAILRFDPATQEAETMSGELPSGRDGTSASWHSGHAYVFGGMTQTTAKLKEIVRYTPGTDEGSSTESSSGASAAESSSSGAPAQGSQSVSSSSDAVPEKRFSDKGSPATSGWAALAVVAVAAWAGRRRA